MRYLISALGVGAALVLVAVSAAMNWRFGVSLGRSELDGQIYGAASVAADLLKALIPFFLFAAIRNRMWSQAAAAAVVGAVVVTYSLTSAFGHAALNRFDTAGQRQVEAQAYKDLRSDLTRAQEQLSWVPQHRPVATVQSDIANLKNQRGWEVTKGCTEVKGKWQRTFCDGYNALSAELGSADQRVVLEARIADTQTKLAAAGKGSVAAEADPQAAVLAKISGLDVSSIQMAMTVFIALLLEIGSSLGLYVALGLWQARTALNGNEPSPMAATADAARDVVTAEPMSAAGLPPAEPASLPLPEAANDVVVPFDDALQALVQRDPVPLFLAEMQTTAPGDYEFDRLDDQFRGFCERRGLKLIAKPTLGRRLRELDVPFNDRMCEGRKQRVYSIASAENLQAAA